MLPDRFDEDGRPLDRDGRAFSRGGGGGQQEMVEKLTKDFGDVVSGKKSWKDMLLGIVEGASSLGSAGGSEGSGSPERPRRRRRRDRDLDRDRDRD